MHGVARIALWAILLYLTYCCLLFLMQRQILFPRYLLENTLESEKAIPGIERIWVETSCGKIETWFLLPDRGQSTVPFPAIIFAHGNAELIDFCLEEIKVFTRMGIGVLLVEYPGYGRSEGTPSQKSITEAFVAAYDVLVARKDVDTSRIILYGRSLGGGAVCALAKKRPSAALILMSTFISVRSFASRYLAPGFFVRDPFDNLMVVATYSDPVLIIHGKSDDLIPYGHGDTLYRASHNGTMLSYDCRHNDCPPDWDKFSQDIESFLRDAGIII